MQSASMAVLICPIRLLILAITGTGGFQWTTVLPNGHVIYACASDHAIFPWNYATSPGDNIINIEWYSSGHSEQMVAINAHSQFLPLPAYSNRVQFVPGAGIVLNDVTVGDSGNYSVQISGSDSSGSTFTTSSFLLLQVTRHNELLTSDGQLHAELDSQPIYSNRTGEWSLVLSCGNFTYVGDPPFQVEWQTPSGNVIPSVSYHNGRFQLYVQTGGQYTCTIPQHAVADACLTSQPKASVSLDKTEARMMLMEVRLNQQQQLLNQQQQLLNQQQQLLNQQQQLISILTNKTSHQIGFFGHLNGSGISGSGVHSGPLPFTTHATNYGDGFTPATGIFSVPVRGLYYLTMTSTSAASDSYPDANMYKNGDFICRAVSAASVFGQSISCSTIQHLVPGDHVWVESGYNLYWQGTSFAGFLIAAD